MGEFNRAGIIDMLLFQIAILNGEITADEAVDLFIQKHFADANSEGGWVG